MPSAGSDLLEVGLKAFTTFFATVGPIDVAALFAALTARTAAHETRRTALKGTLIATLLLLAFVVFGEAILRLLGITLAAVRVAGGILLLLLAIDMVMGRPLGLSSTTPAETAEARERADLSVFPLATPLIAGPGALGAAVLLAAESGDSVVHLLVIIAALLAVMAATLALLLVAGRLRTTLGLTGQNVVSRVVGILLAALAVQFIFDGVRGSGIV